MEEIIERIERIIGDIAQAKGVARPKVDESTRLLGSGLPIDSLDLASLLVQLQEATDYDPFQAGFIEFRTVGELARLYLR